MRRGRSLSLNSPGSGMMEAGRLLNSSKAYGKYIVTVNLRHRVFKRVGPA
ncbi:hypothetical protein [Paenibacillus sp. MMO-177]